MYAQHQAAFQPVPISARRQLRADSTAQIRVPRCLQACEGFSRPDNSKGRGGLQLWVAWSAHLGLRLAHGHKIISPQLGICHRVVCVRVQHHLHTQRHMLITCKVQNIYSNLSRCIQNVSFPSGSMNHSCFHSLPATGEQSMFV